MSGFVEILREEAQKAADLAGPRACCLSGVSFSAVGVRPPVSLLLPNDKGQAIAVPKVQFVSPEALVFFVQQVAKRCDQTAVKAQVKQVLELNQAGHKCAPEAARVAAKACDNLVHWRMEEHNCNEEFLEKRKQAIEQRKEAEKAQKQAEKDKAKEAKKAEKAASSSSSDEAEKPVAKRAPKRKRSDAEEGSPTPASSPSKPAESSEEKQDKPKVKRVRKEKSAPKPREALGLAVDETIGSFQPALGDNWDSMAQ